MSIMRVKTETLTALTDEIGRKTGIDEALTAKQAIIDIAAIPTIARNIPAYVRGEAERVAGVVKSLQNANTVSFIAVTDIHAQPTDTTTKQNYAEGIKHCAQAIQLVRGLVPIDFAASLGDFVYGSVGETAETHRENLMRAMRVLSMAAPDFRLLGNHDAHYHVADSYMERGDIYRYCARFNGGLAIAPDTEADRGYFYADLADKKLRVICLNTADLDPATIPTSANRDGHYVSATQLRWLVGLLDMTGKSDWGIVILSHHPVHWGQKYPTVNSPMNIVLGMLEAYVAGTSGSAVTQVEGETITYDFSGKNAARLIGTIHGHTHNLIHDYQGDHRIIRLGTPNACQDRTNEYGSSAYDEKHRALFGEATTYPKSPNSAADTAFVVYTVDLNQQVIYATCYGAGYDRMMVYGDLKYLEVTLDMKKVTSSNTTPITAENLPYTTTLTPADGYDLYSVTVTMGGEDITATAYKDGVVTIQQVTGEISISAIATYILPEGMENLITTALDPSSTAADGAVFNGVGYMDGKYLTVETVEVDGFQFRTSAGMVQTGLIPYLVNTKNPATIYIRGHVDVTANKNCRIHLWKDGKLPASTTPIYLGVTTDLAKYFTVTKDDDLTTLVPVINSQGYSPIRNNFGAAVTYMSFSFSGTGAGLIIVKSAPATLDYLLEDDMTGDGGEVTE